MGWIQLTSPILPHIIGHIAPGLPLTLCFEYTLVADAVADLSQGKLSVNSPIGKGLLGKKVGDIAEIQVPSGVMKFEIIDISR